MLSLGKRLGWTFSQTTWLQKSSAAVPLFTFESSQKCMSSLEGKSRRHVAKLQRLKYEKRINSLDSDHAKDMPSKIYCLQNKFFVANRS